MGPGIFWSLQFEVWTSIVEGINELMLLVGRPTQTVNVPYTIQPGSVWQDVPKGMFCITGIQGAASQLYKITLQDLDYTQSNNGSDWENDVGDTVERWAPIGFTKFIAYPVVTEAQNVLVTGIALPTTEGWPYSGNSLVPFHDEFLDAIEKYAAAYLAFKEGSGGEFTVAIGLLKDFMGRAKRASQIEDRRDDYIFNRAIGSQAQPNPNERR